MFCLCIPQCELHTLETPAFMLKVLPQRSFLFLTRMHHTIFYHWNCTMGWVLRRYSSNQVFQTLGNYEMCSFQKNYCNSAPHRIADYLNLSDRKVFWNLNTEKKAMGFHFFYFSFFSFILFVNLCCFTLWRKCNQEHFRAIKKVTRLCKLWK